MKSKQETSYGVIPVSSFEGEYYVFMIRHQNGNFWGFPKGHLEEGESPLDAAYRELAEETSLSVLSLLLEKPFLESYTYITCDTTVEKKVYFYLAHTTKDASIDPKELQEGRWVRFKEAENLATYQECKGLCQKVASFLTLEKPNV